MANQAQSKSKDKDAAKEDTSKKSSQSNGNSSNNGGDLGKKIESLHSTLSGDLSNVESEAALGLIDEWYDVLHKAKEPEIKELSSHLKELKQLLKGGKATAHEISEVLSEIGEQTSEYATDVEKGLKNPLRQIGQQLSKVGNSLAKAEEHEQIQEINSLVETFDDGLGEVDKEAATSSIDTWYNVLHKSEDESIKEIAEGLKQLKHALKLKNPKGAEISSILSKLGEQTVAASQEAKRGFKGPIQRLGKLLSKSAKSIEG
jgi:phosphopantetheine adenylyltransferase